MIATGLAETMMSECEFELVIVCNLVKKPQSRVTSRRIEV
jgi:hypothetical protein